MARYWFQIERARLCDSAKQACCYQLLCLCVGAAGCTPADWDCNQNRSQAAQTCSHPGCRSRSGLSRNRIVEDGAECGPYLPSQLRCCSLRHDLTAGIRLEQAHAQHAARLGWRSSFFQQQEQYSSCGRPLLCMPTV